MDKVQPLEWVVLLDAPVEVNTTLRASITLNNCVRVNDLELRLVRGDPQFLLGDDADNGEEISFRLPALRTTAGMVMRNVAVKCHLDTIVWAVAVELPAGEVFLPLCDAIIDQWVKRWRHLFDDANDSSIRPRRRAGIDTLLLEETTNGFLHSENRALFITSHDEP